VPSASALAQAQASGRVASLVLTGGSVARLVHAAVAKHPDRAMVDWTRVEIWWGDDRFVPADDPERNAGQAWSDLLRHLPVDPARVHTMPAADDGHGSVEAAARAYGQELRARVGGDQPWFDVLMLGIGPDGHCASLFPQRPEVRSSADVLAVHDSPKPPPVRISLGMSTLGRAEHVMFVATGDEKAEAVARSVQGEDVLAAPAAGPRGGLSTTWYVDEAAAARLP